MFAADIQLPEFDAPQPRVKLSTSFIVFLGVHCGGKLDLVSLYGELVCFHDDLRSSRWF
jgi:hypothetical protein